MKILAAVIDLVHVKTDGKIKQYYITKIRKCLVYDPSKVRPCHYGMKDLLDLNRK